MGWEIVVVWLEDYCIEVMDILLFFGFKDDVVICV